MTRGRSQSLKSLLFLLNALFFMGGAGTFVIAAIDELSDPGVPADASNVQDAVAAPDYPGSGRVFALFIDSLRDQTALNQELMPNLAALRLEATSAAVETVYDAITAPAVRAAFTGRSHFRVLGFVQNFIHHATNLPSLFSQLKEGGAPTAVFSDNTTFAQFGNDIAGNYLAEAGGAPTESARQSVQAHAALDRYLAGKERLVIFHLVYVDHVAHKQGIFHPEYRSEVAEADLLVGELAKRIAPTDTLVVFGDHGHTDTGRHALGLDVPTYISLRGPGFRRGLVLDQIHITTYRYLFSWALKLPLAADYSRERHPEALVSAPGARLPSAYSQPPVATAKPPTAGGAGTIGLYCLMALLVGLAFGLWWLVGDVIATGSATFKPRRIVRILVFTAVAALPVFAVGVALALLRSYVHEPFFPTISRIWAVVLIVTLVASRRFDLGWLALTVLGVPFLLLYPTTYRYGAPSVFAPAWLCWAATAYCLSYGFRDGLAEVRYVALGRWRVRRSTLLFAALVFFVQPFFFTDAVNFEFERFKALSPELAPTALWAQALAGAFGAWIIFYRRAEGLANRLVATSFVLGFLAVFFHIVPEGSLGEFFVGAGLLFGAVAVHRRARLGFLHAEAKGLARSLFLAALFVCYFYFVRVSSELRLDAVMLFAALRLSVLLLDHVPVARRNLKSNGVFLLVIGLIVSGWVSLSWGLTHLEWHAAYDFFPPKVVEEFVGLFLPLIVLKYALPVLIAKSLVLEGVRLEEIYPARQMALAIGVKFGTLILLVLGLGYYTPGSNVYLEATGELAIFLSLAAGML